MGHYEDAYEADYARQREEDRLRAAKAWGKIEDIIAQLDKHICETGITHGLDKPFEVFKDATIAWRYKENLLEDTTELVLNKLSED